jgi:glycosyltransferase involved in cell wall biosynthesis
MPPAFRDTLASLVPKRVRQKFASLVYRARLRRSLELVAGEATAAASPQDVIVTCVVRNGEEYIPEFIRHYVALGVRHIAFLDNGSTDRTVALASRYPNVTIYRADVPYRPYEAYLRRFIIRQFSGQNWMLHVDIDEFFDYPCSDRVSLSNLIRYLNRYHYSVVLMHMLDLFPETGVRWDAEETPSLSTPTAQEAFREEHRCYDISHLSAHPYNLDNRVSNPAVRLYRGGLRGALLGATGFPLFKHSLFLPASGATFRHPHLVDGGHLADFTGVLYHYKFTSRFQARVLDAVKLGNYYNQSNMYKQFLHTFNHEASALSNLTSITRLQQVQELVENGFLVVSDQYRQFADGLTWN